MKNGLTVLMVIIAVATATASYVSFTPLDTSRNHVELAGDLRANGGSSVVSGAAMNLPGHPADTNFSRKAVHATMTAVALDSDDETRRDQDEGGEDETTSGDDKNRDDHVREG